MAPVPQVPEIHYDVEDEESLLLLKTDDVSKSSTATINYYNSFQDDEEATHMLDDSPPETACCYPIRSFAFHLWDLYFKALQQRPLWIKSITAFILMGCADMIAQGVEHGRGLPHRGNGVDWLRTLRFANFGILGAPWTHYYYEWLDGVLPPTPEPWTWTTAGTYRKRFHEFT